MFGQNPLRKQERGNGVTLLVHSIFGTIQGEGPFSGHPAVFVRLAGCNLACYFCDTDFESNVMHLRLEDIFETIEAERRKVKTNLIVLTGGEPLRQPVAKFIGQCLERGLHVQIETSGTVWPDGMDSLMDATPDGLVTIVCSPKTGKVHPKVELYCRDWKYIIADGEFDERDGLPMYSTQVEGRPMTIYRASQGTIWVQPREDYKLIDCATIDGQVPKISAGTDEHATAANMRAAAEIAMRFGYRLTLQTHKILELP